MFEILIKMVTYECVTSVASERLGKGEQIVSIQTFARSTFDHNDQQSDQSADYN
jgi:hypothetical protein